MSTIEAYLRGDRLARNDFVNFWLMPLWGRIPFVAGVSLGWTAIISAMRGKPRAEAHNASQ